MPSSQSKPRSVPVIARRGVVPGLALMSSGLAGAFGIGAATVTSQVVSAPAKAAAVPVMAGPQPPAPKLYSAAARENWLAFRHQYVTPDGRVIDTGNEGVSHSEGQGWGLIAAQAADDPASFARILAWTTQALRRRPMDRLHAWRYRPAVANPVADLNNATDGDLYIAAALARAAVRWGRADYAAQAAGIAHDVLGLVCKAGPRTVLLPGAEGFAKPDCLLVNPSYYTFGLFDDLAAVAPSPLWRKLRVDGAALVLQARFGRWQLPADWVRVDRADGSLRIAPGWPPRFSWDAIRVPLHLAWGGVAAKPLFDSFRDYWTAGHQAPAWTDLTTGEVAPYAAPAGVRAVAALASADGTLDASRSFPSMSAATDYYGAGLVLLSRLAAEEGQHRG